MATYAPPEYQHYDKSGQKIQVGDTIRPAEGYFSVYGDGVVMSLKREEIVVDHGTAGRAVRWGITKQMTVISSRKPEWE